MSKNYKTTEVYKAVNGMTPSDIQELCEVKETPYNLRDPPEQSSSDITSQVSQVKSNSVSKSNIYQSIN